MLNKNPSARPTVKQIVKTPYITSHISQLLSFTLTAGNGGIEGGVPLPQQQLQRHLPTQNNYVSNAAGAAAAAAIDAEAVDRNIERVRQQQLEDKRQREKESKEAAYHSEREKLRVEGSENLKRMIKEKKGASRQAGGSHGGDGAENGDNDMVDGDVTIVTAGRIPHPAPLVHVSAAAAAPTPRGGQQPVASARDRESNVGGRGQQSQQQQQARVEPVASSRDPQPNMKRGQSLAELQEERRREAERIRQQIDGPGSNRGGGGGGGGGAGGYDMIISNRQQGNVNSNNNYDNYRRGGSQANDDMADYQRQVSKQYWENREAAKAAKERVSAMEQGVGGSSHSQQQQQQVQQYRSQQQQLQYGRGGAADNYSAQPDLSRMSPEERINMLKAEKERKQEQKNAEYERELQIAREQQREQVRRIQERQRSQQGLAFNVDVGPSNQAQKDLPLPGSAQSNVNDDYDSNSAAGGGNADGQKQRKKWGPPPSVDEIRPSNYLRGAVHARDSPTSASSSAAAAKEKEGGPGTSNSNRKVSPALAAPVASHNPPAAIDEDEYDVDQLATLPKGAFNYNSRRHQQQQGGATDGGGRSPAVGQHGHQSDTELEEGEKHVLMRLEEQENKKHAARMEAKEVSGLLIPRVLFIV
jgi:hypothetical protein